jgi:hypothetical protein
MINFALGAAALALPVVLGFGWAGAWTWMPDAALVVLGLGALLTAGSVTRLIALMRPGPDTP